MDHVTDLWFERVVRRPSSRDYLEVSHVLVVLTDLLTDLEILDVGGLDYLESELRRIYLEANDIRFVPAGRGAAYVDLLRDRAPDALVPPARLALPAADRIA